MCRRFSKGFTLIEIAIALVIIGLLVGGILKGQDLIRQAKVRKLESMVMELRAAVSAYYRSVGKLPGDENSDSRISGSIEIDKVFPDMVNLNLISGNTSQTTRTHIFGGTVTIEYYAATVANCIKLTDVPSDVIKMLDTKFDDDNKDDGVVRAPGCDCDSSPDPATSATVYLPL